MSHLKQASIYKSLTQPPMLMGLPQTATFLGLGAVFLVCVGSGYNLIVITVTLTISLTALPFLRRMFEKEPFMMDILPSYFNWPPYMPHHSKMTRTPPADSVPKSPYN